MASIKNPSRAMALASVLVLAGCGSGIGLADGMLNGTTGAVADAAVAESAIAGEGASAAAATKVDQDGPLVGDELEQLVTMSGALAEDGTLGSGCAIHNGEDLPDGDWFGFVIEAARTSVTVDIACAYGPETDQFLAYAATENAEQSNYIVINDVAEERKLSIAPGALAFLAAQDWQPLAASTLADRQVKDPDERVRGFWLRVEDGRVVAVVQPYAKGVASG